MYLLYSIVCFLAKFMIKMKVRKWSDRDRGDEQKAEEQKMKKEEYEHENNIISPDTKEFDSNETLNS